MSNKVISVVDAPIISRDEGEKEAYTLFEFYKSLGWNGKDRLDPCKILVSKNVLSWLYEVVYEKLFESMSIMAIIDISKKTPSVSADVPQGKVHLLEGWVAP
jgi:hypothetical protein